jgi:NAD(P)-dependent dehydrogenase (short-subunit alcohol dehydrogenase family)
VCRAINNAGGGEYRPVPLADMSVEDFDRTVAVNLRSTFLSLKYEITGMLESGGGAIVNMSSKAGLSGSARGISPYVAAKHGVIGLTKIAAVEYADRNIRVNAVAPGPIGTERIAALSDERREQIVRAVPMARIGAPTDVATTVAWLRSDLSSFVTGVTVPIDGGQLAL